MGAGLLAGVQSSKIRHEGEIPDLDFRVNLQKELIARRKLNPSYSLRAFARFLKIEPSHLSKILSGKRPLTTELLDSMGQKLNLTLQQIELLRTSLPQRWKRKSKEKTPLHELLDSPVRNKYLGLTQDTFEIISDWHHYAILELMKLRGFQPDAKWIGKSLNITSSEVSYFVDRLVRVGLLSIVKSPAGIEKWKDLSDGFSSHVLGENYTSYAHKKAQAEILELALRALHDLPIERRDQSSTMISTHHEKIQEAKLMIKEFRLRLTDFLEDCDEKNSILQLSVSLFPLVENQD